jgi:hypothetical protein
LDKPSTTPWSDTQKILALLVVGAFIAMIFVWIFYPPKADAGSLAVLNTLTGALGTMTMTIITWYFGSSRDSRTKDATIAGTIPVTATPPAPGPNGNHATPATSAG